MKNDESPGRSSPPKLEIAMCFTSPVATAMALFALLAALIGGMSAEYPNPRETYGLEGP